MSAARLITMMAIVIYSASVAYFVWLGLMHPYKNWDIIGYVATAFSWHYDPPVIIHEKTLAAVKAVTAPWPYEYFVKTTKNLNAPAFLTQMIPFYEVKPLYVALMWLITPLGIDIASASWVVSAISFGLLALLIMCWRPVQASYAWWLLSVTTLMWMGSKTNNIARASTPDALNLLCLVLCMLAWWRYRSAVGFILAGLAAIASRPDSLILVGVLSAFFAFCADSPHRMPLKIAAITVIMSGLLYVSIQQLAHAYSWDKLFYHTLMHHMENMQQDISIDWKRYLHGLKWGAKNYFSFPIFLSMAAMSLISLLAYERYPAGQRQWRDLLILAWFAFFIRFALFPAFEIRYYYAYHLLTLLACMELLSPAATALVMHVKSRKSPELTS